MGPEGSPGDSTDRPSVGRVDSDRLWATGLAVGARLVGALSPGSWRGRVRGWS